MQSKDCIKIHLAVFPGFKSQNPTEQYI